MTGLLSRPGSPRTEAAGLVDASLALARRHWVLVALMAAGVVLRVLAQIAYRPALFYIDTIKYLYNAYPGSDPVGYKAPLRAILAVGGLSTVTAVQHLLGLAMAAAIYVMLLRRGAPRWLAAIAAAPVLLDAYQIQIEQTIMPDVWFEAALVAAIAALLAAGPAQSPASTAQTGGEQPGQAGTGQVSIGQTSTGQVSIGQASTGPASNAQVGDGQAGDGQAGDGQVSARRASNGQRRLPRGLAVVVAGLLLGASATVRQVGEILILPALLYVVAVGGGWRTVLARAAALTVAFAVPVVGYMAGSYVISGHLWLASATPSLATYGRMATAADCAALRIPRYERALCPTAQQRAYGIDWLDHDAASPLKMYAAPAGMNRYAVIASFDHQVAEQQPLRVARAIAGDGLKLFALTRTSSQEGTPISRWQFQEFYPTYGNWVMLDRHLTIVLGLRLTPGSPTITLHPLDRGYGGRAAVDKPIAAALRAYQLHGGYAPGPLMAVFALAGLAGSVLALVRRPAGQRRGLGLACLAFFATGAAVLIASDAFQFSWRYQLPALVTLPPAGVAALAIAGHYLFSRRSAS